jgi:predicted glycoside hydrolase/deacetylase ChbG (UPF0249 family)
MATGPSVEQAAREARRFPNASFGVHMNLTTHRPLTTSRDLQPLLLSDGTFNPRGVYEHRGNARVVAAVVDELTAQVRKIRELGVPISHLDSHHHVHTLPWLFTALKRVQRATGIRRVRGTLSILDGDSSVRRVAMKRAWRFALRHAIYSTTTTDEFAEFVVFQRVVASGRYAPAKWPSVIELMVHPTDDVAYSGEENRMLRSPWMEQLPIRGSLISYNSL